MADPTVEEESLISQDDIDKLLDASSIEEAEEKLDAPDEGPDLSLDDVGELSQDDIDNLLGGSTLDSDDTPEDDGGELSQDDIDSLMGGGDEPDDDEDMELISQDDIDRLMNPSDDAADGEGEDDDDELISMDDIQSLITEDDPDEPEPEAVETPAAPEESVQQAPDSGDPLDQVIAESEAVAVDESLMTQDAMDELIRNAPDPVAPEDAVETVDLGEEPVSLDLDGEEADSKDELDALLGADDADFSLDPGGEDGDVTQEDIDALLQESDDDDGFLDEDDDILISQDDIDTLLMAADQEDEDVLGDLLGDSVDGSMDDFDEEEIVDSSPEDAGDTDQVVLEGSDDPLPPKEDQPKGKIIRIPAFLQSKWVLAAASVLLVMGISIPAAYFLFFSGKKVVLPEKETVPVASEERIEQPEVASVTIEEEASLVTTRQSGTIVLANFVVLASDLAKDMTYVYADISIDYSDQRAYHEINNNLSFYRDLIYEAIQSNLVSERRNEVTQADLIWGVETSLKKVLPPHFIEKISFKTFRTS